MNASVTAGIILTLALGLTARGEAGPVPAPAGMCRIDGGPYQRGCTYPTTNWWGMNATPVHTVQVSTFTMDRTEVTKELWDTVCTWAATNGYAFANDGMAMDSNHPVVMVSWHDCVVWCNARSEREGLPPVYFTGGDRKTVYRQVDFGRVLTNDCVAWDGAGYRLPTEAEWEKAARGKLVGHYYPWPSFGGEYTNYLDGGKANYDGSGDPWETFPISTTPVGYYNGRQNPPGKDMANGYGLYDMAGNVIEWMWDWYEAGWYADPASRVADSRGPNAKGKGWKTLKGGSNHTAKPHGLFCSLRLFNYTPDYVGFSLGFRCARTAR